MFLDSTPCHLKPNPKTGNKGAIPTPRRLPGILPKPPQFFHTQPAKTLDQLEVRQKLRPCSGPPSGQRSIDICQISINALYFNIKRKNTEFF